jgi:hypothetical protein
MAIKKPPPDDPVQSARFIETAKVVEASSGEMFTRVLKKIVPGHKAKGFKSKRRS